MVEISYSSQPLSTQPFGYYTRIKKRSSGNMVYLHGTNEEAVVPNTHRFMRTDINPNYIFGVTKAVNVTTSEDITDKVTKVSDYAVTFDSNNLSDNELVEIDMYVNWEGIRDDYNNASGTITKLSSELIEQLYRFTSNLDRTDFGNYSPPFDSVFDLVTTSHDSTKYTVQPRIFFACNGYYSTDTVSGSSVVSGGPITKTSRTIINYSVANPNTVGGFIGDPIFASTKGGNENYTLFPIPIYLTRLSFFCKLKNSSFDYDVAEAVKLNFSIDGQSRALGTAPDYEYPSDIYPMQAAFGTDEDLLLSFCGDETYQGVPPVYTYGKNLDDGEGGTTAYYLFYLPLQLVRINSGITVSASLLSGEDGETEIEDYVFTLGGIMPTTWEAS
jgi:hypothetical protein